MTLVYLFLRFGTRIGAPVALACAAIASAHAYDPADPEVRRAIHGAFGPGGTAAFQSDHGMVATASHHATIAGLETLRAGGNAFDAAAVVQFVLAVAEPYASGIGGGLLMVAYDAETGEIVNLDGREEAPRDYHPDVFRDDAGAIIPFRERATGGIGVGVPGTPAAIAKLLETHGTITLAKALEPAIRLARDGFVVTEPFARNLAEHRDRLQHYPESMRLFTRDDGQLLQAGDRFANPALADTLRRIADEGIAVFYQGAIAEAIVETVRGDHRLPGLLTIDDLANYRAVLRKPVSVEYRGYDVYGMNMPTSGGATLGLMLNLLEAAGYADLPHHSADAIHILAEAQNLAFADRNRYMGDADFATVPVDALLDKEYARKRAKQIDLRTPINPPLEPGTPPGKGPSTTHFAIVDSDRNAVSITSTIEQHFGSAMVVPGHGFLLNNQLTDFEAEAYDDGGDLVPNAPEGGWRKRRTARGAAAETEGGKRPRSSMSPTLVMRDGKPRLVLGSPGGSRIIGITLNALLNTIDGEMDVQVAVNTPRVIARNGPVELETPLYRDQRLRSDLEERRFEVLDIDAVGSVQAIWIDAEGRLHGAADPRREGLAAGY